MNSIHDIPVSLYPITIRQSRYGGVYEGGAWFCIGGSEVIPDDAIGDDMDAVCFWSDPNLPRLIGRGGTPKEAMDDMIKRHTENELSTS